MNGVYTAAECLHCLAFSDVDGESSLHKLLRKRDGKTLSNILTLNACRELTLGLNKRRQLFFTPSLFPLMCFHPVAGAGTALSKSSVAVPPSKAQEFLAKLSRTKRNIWDRSRPDVQQWIMQFMYMGFDEQVSCAPHRRGQGFSELQKNKNLLQNKTSSNEKHSKVWQIKTETPQKRKF